MFCMRALMTQKSCAVGMGNGKLGNHLSKLLDCENNNNNYLFTKILVFTQKSQTETLLY